MDELILIALGIGVLALLAQSQGSSQGISFTDALGNSISSFVPLTFPKVSANSIVKVSQAFSVAEGYGEFGAIPTRGNNPGDLTFGFGYATTGVLNSDGVLAFATPQDGWNALFEQVGRMLSGTSGVYSLDETLQTVGGTYAGDAVAWPANVASQLGVSIQTTLRELQNV